MSDLAKALMVAIRVHAGQVDKQGEPYLLHVLRVVEAVSDEAEVVAALHDVIEDYSGPFHPEQLLRGTLDAEDWVALEALTRKPSRWTYADYIEQIAGHADRPGAIAREVKLADLRDNLDRIPEPPDEMCPACDGLGCGYCSKTGKTLDTRQWARTWAPLKARYEKAIATLEAVHSSSSGVSS